MKIQRILILSLITLSFNVFGQNKKTKTFTIERTIQASAAEVWRVVGEEYADIAKSHPKLSGSHHVEGTAMNGEGCERVCSLDDKGKKFTKETQVDYNPKEQSFKALISEAGGLPINSAETFMIYDVDPIDENSCKITLTMTYQTDPAFLGGMAKGKFKKNIEDYAIGIEHHVLTGEDVNPSNFKEIKKLYKS